MYKALEASLGDRLEHPDRLERRAAARRPHTREEREVGAVRRGPGPKETPATSSGKKKKIETPKTPSG